MRWCRFRVAVPLENHALIIQTRPHEDGRRLRQRDDAADGDADDGDADDEAANEDADEETRAGRKGCINNYAGSPLQRTHPTDRKNCSSLPPAARKAVTATTVSAYNFGGSLSTGLPALTL